MYGTNGIVAPPANAIKDETAANLADGKSPAVTPNSSEV
jgi:hypothetical protein